MAAGPRLKIDLTTGMYRFELEQEPAGRAAGPATSASPPLTAPGPARRTDPSRARCPPGKQCLLFYPKEAKRRPRSAVKKVLPDAPAAKTGDGWQPSTSASPAQRGD